jgi:pimeloyl-ACP methyl ester carboxylesterase
MAALLTTASSAAALSPDGPGHAPAPGPKPTVVLVHGAFSDASGWRGVIKRLQRLGYPVVAPANPLRDLAGDSAYIASVLDSIEGPVVLVGHSYGGMVITNAAAATTSHVKALVYIAAYAPDTGESAAELTEKFPGSLLRASVNQVPCTLPGGGTRIDLYVKPDTFRTVLLPDISARTAAVMAASQRPITVAATTGESRAAAWRFIPSWYLVATRDRALPPAAERFMAECAGSYTVEVDAPHFAMVSHPGAVTRLILAAATGRADPSADAPAEDRAGSAACPSAPEPARSNRSRASLTCRDTRALVRQVPSRPTGHGRETGCCASPPLRTAAGIRTGFRW